MHQNIVKKLSFVIIYVSDQYKTQKICNKVITENFGVLKFIPDYYRNQKKCDKAVNNYFYALELMPNCYKTKRMCCETVDTCPFVFHFVLE